MVEISTNGGAEFTDDGVEFRYRSPASASTLFPLSGPDVGGTQIGIIGKHFQDSAFSEIQCRFDFSPVPLFRAANYVNESFIECVTPLAPAALASVSMMLTLNGEDYFPIGTGDSTFTFYPREYVTSVFPSRVLISGGTKIILRGGNYVFSQHLKCRFGGEKTTKATYFNTSAISCVVPPLRSHRVGDAVFVEVANNGIDFVDLSSPNKGTQLIYIAPPRVTKITPSRIVYGVPTTVYIKGSAFAFKRRQRQRKKNVVQSFLQHGSFLR